MPTQLNQKQVKGVNYDDITLELKGLKDKTSTEIKDSNDRIAYVQTAQTQLKAAVDTRLGYLHGQVNSEAELLQVSAPIDAHVFVKDKNQYYRKTSLGWIPILGGSSGSGGGASGQGIDYAQVMKLGVTAPYSFPIMVQRTSEYDRPPLEVLILKTAEQTSTMNLTFSNNAHDYLFNPDAVSFNTELELKQVISLPMEASLDNISRKKITKNDYIRIDKINVK